MAHCNGFSHNTDEKPIHFSFGPQSSLLPEAHDDAEGICIDDTQPERKHSLLDNYDAIQKDISRKEVDSR